MQRAMVVLEIENPDSINNAIVSQLKIIELCQLQSLKIVSSGMWKM